MNGAGRIAVCVALGLALSACSMTSRREPAETRAPAPVPPLSAPKPAGVPSPPANLLEVPDAVPRYEPRARNGNPPFYQVFGKRYYVMASSVGYLERGVASWYGPGFHAERTSIGEPYDMYGMTAAHKTLSLPTYVRVTNLENNRSVIVRVNDRGPFVGNRIIDLSYTAAAKLDMLKRGTAFVEVRAIDPLANPITAVTPVTSALLTAPPPAPGTPAPTNASASSPATATTPASAATANTPASGATAAPAAIPSVAAGGVAPPANAPGAAPAARGALFVQAGAFSNRANAERLASRLRTGQYGSVFVRESQMAGKTMYRVRIGPVADVPAFDRTVKALERAGVLDAHLAPD